MTEEKREKLKRSAKGVLAAGAISYGGLVPVYLYSIFEQKEVAQAAHADLKDSQKEIRLEYREDFKEIQERIEKRLNRMDDKLDLILKK